MSSWFWAICAICGWLGFGYLFIARRRYEMSQSTSLVNTSAPEIKEKSRNESQLVLDALTLGIVVIDAQGREMYRNTAAEDITGARHADVLVDAIVERLLVTASGGVAVTEQMQLAGPPARVLVVAAQPLQGGGAMATINDITQQWRLDQVRTDFVANVSHELKTPVGALSVLAETIEGETQDELILRLVKRMVMETQRMAVTIDDLLELSRIEMGEQMLVVDVDMNDVVAEVIERTTPVATHKGVALHLVGTSEKVLVSGNFSQLVSAVGNLVGNAIKYSDEGQMVTVALRATVTSVELSVEDKGIGIPMASLNRIFERFYRVDRARSRGTGGTGLGLSIVRHVATNHGGEVNVRSREGEGSTFCLVLPRQVAGIHGTIHSNGEQQNNDK
jgi:two-component system sensor histidine kinase SenX3